MATDQDRPACRASHFVDDREPCILGEGHDGNHKDRHGNVFVYDFGAAADILKDGVKARKAKVN